MTRIDTDTTSTTVGRGDALVGRCYTRARRLPLMIGRLPGGRGQVWGGPYTLTQFLTACVALVVLWQTYGIWARFSTGWDALILLGVPALLAWLVRRARIEGRDPLRAAVGVVAFLAYPSTGRLAGRTWRPAGPRWTGRCRFFVSDTRDRDTQEPDTQGQNTQGRDGEVSE